MLDSETLVPVSGYLANEVWMIEEAIKRKLAIYDCDIFCPDSEGLEGIQHMARIIIREVGIPGLTLTPVWVGENLVMFSWSVPMSWFADNKTPDQEAQLHKLIELAHIPECARTPLRVYSIEGPMPSFFRGKMQLHPNVQKLRIDSSPYYHPENRSGVKEDFHEACRKKGLLWI